MDTILFLTALAAGGTAAWAFTAKVASDRALSFATAREAKLRHENDLQAGKLNRLREDNRVLRIAEAELAAVKAQRAAALEKANAAVRAKAAAKKSGAA